MLWVTFTLAGGLQKPVHIQPSAVLAVAEDHNGTILFLQGGEKILIEETAADAVMALSYTSRDRK